MLDVAACLVAIEHEQRHIEGAINAGFALHPADEQVSSYDLIHAGAANRSRALVNSFLALIKQDLLVAALPLVRLQLDSALRLVALGICADPESTAELVLTGTSLRRLRDTNNELMTDTYLCRRFAEIHDAPEIIKVYDEMSGYVHLSKEHALAVLQRRENGRFDLILTGSIGHPQKARILAANDFHGITGTLANYFVRYANDRFGATYSK